MPIRLPYRDEIANEKCLYRFVTASQPPAPFPERGSIGPLVRQPRVVALGQPLHSVSPRAGLRSELARVPISVPAAIQHLVAIRVPQPRSRPVRRCLQSHAESPARLLDLAASPRSEHIESPDDSE